MATYREPMLMPRRSTYDKPVDINGGLTFIEVSESKHRTGT